VVQSDIASKGVPLQPPEALPLLGRAFEANLASINHALAVAAEGVASDIEVAAKDAGRSFDFTGLSVQRDRKTARLLNDQALTAFYSERNFSKAYEIQVDAFRADPLDVEIASNLGIFSFRLGKVDEAYRYAVYALSLPRAPDRTGRTADWNTVAAVLASQGDSLNARNALYLTLAIAPDVKKRCQSAVYSVRNIYGPVLKRPTEAMFDRIRTQGLSDAGECALPIAW
jgi:tetratricopeptide (TPR) repeat protein